MAKLPPFDQQLVVSDIVDLMIKGFRTKQIYVFTEKKYNLSKPQTDRYIKKAREAFKPIDNKKKTELRSKYRARLEDMYNQAMYVQKDMGLALRIQGELNKLVEHIEGEVQMPNINVVFQMDGDDDGEK